MILIPTILCLSFFCVFIPFLSSHSSLSSIALPSSLYSPFLSLFFLLARPGRQVRSNDHKSSRTSSKSQSSESPADASKFVDPKAPRTSSEPPKKEDTTAHHHSPSEGKEETHTPVRSNGDQASRADSQASTRSLVEKPQGRGLGAGKNPLSESQVRLLVGLHYLPHEYGPAAKSLLQDLTWLKANCQYVSANGNKKKVLPQKVSQRSPEVIRSYPTART